MEINWRPDPASGENMIKASFKVDGATMVARAKAGTTGPVKIYSNGMYIGETSRPGWRPWVNIARAWLSGQAVAASMADM